MALTEFRFNTGPQGAAVPSGGGVTLPGGATYDAAASMEGAFGLSIAQPASTIGRAEFAVSSADQLTITFFYKMTRSAAVGQQIFAVYNTLTGVAALQMSWSGASNQIALKNANGSIENYALTPSPNAMVVGTWYRFVVVLDRAATTITVKVYAADGSPLYSYTNTAWGTWDSPNMFYLGGLQNDRSATFVHAVDYVAFNTGTTAEIPAPANQPPTVTVNQNRTVAPGSTFALSATASDVDGTIASRQWAYDYPSSGGPALTGANTADASATAGAAGSLYVLRHTVTDDGGLTGSATTEVRVPTSGSATLRPLPGAGTGTGAWAKVGSAASEGEALADSSDATYVESPAISSTPTRRRWRWQPTSARSAASIVLRLGLDSGTAAVIVRLLEGNLTRQSWSQAITTTPTDYTFTISAAALAAITDSGNLFLEVEA